MARGEAFALLDVREQWERAHCAITVSASAVDLHIPMRAIPSRLDEIRAQSEGRPFVVYCHHGVRSP